MQKLNFPEYQYRFKNKENKLAIFDEIRKKFILVTPEEWVRQNCVHYLIKELNYPKSHINVEKLVKINGINKRYDIVIFNLKGEIEILVECKAPSVTINQATFDQIAQYNLKLKANYLMVTNGLNHYFCQMDFENEKYSFLKTLPKFEI
ncbi:MAG: hypothetical protein ACI9XR_000901 [Flavobacterium sp.]|jgi:hypothetical protein